MATFKKYETIKGLSFSPGSCIQVKDDDSSFNSSQYYTPDIFNRAFTPSSTSNKISVLIKRLSYQFKKSKKTKIKKTKNDEFIVDPINPLSSLIEINNYVKNRKKKYICSERRKDVKLKYSIKRDLKTGNERFDVTETIVNRNPVVNFVKGYILPHGYPESVHKNFDMYMKWRALQYFFGGAISVFTTK